MTVATTTFADLKKQSDERSQIRKILEGMAFWMPDTVPVPEHLTSESKDLLKLHDDVIPLGIVAKEGYKFNAEQTKEETEAFGYADAQRTDVVKMPRSVEFTMLQSLRREISEFVYGLDLSAVRVGSNGEVTFDELPIPIYREGRLLIIGRDGVGSEEILEGRCYTRAKLAEPPAEAWGDSATQLPIKVDVFSDLKVGTPCRHWIGGRGFDATAHGWLPAA